ncbi:hypothetical protein KC323_g6127 [Hortaea werneckii]|nr:hypothetical protein KC323_g6127 [Hortaea werneckii]KAI7350455.1 hypothetical protein KC320_g5479 [Hortaea werneckii]
MSAWQSISSQSRSVYSPPAAETNAASELQQHQHQHQYQRYPSPGQQSGLPFYQQPDANQRRSSDRHDPPTTAGASEDGNATQAPDGDADQDDTDQEPVPDDPQLRQNLTSMMGTFQGTPHQTPHGRPTPYLDQHSAGPPQSQLHTPQQMDGSPTRGHPPSSYAFAQAHNGASAAAPAQPLRNTPKERTKVSRACDECRRKKIRCDAVDETGQTPCSNCARTSARCAFSRQPMKRGPSKGYIKELAERLNSLEREVGGSSNGVVGEREREIRELRGSLAEQGVLPMTFDTGPRVGEKRSRDAAELGGYNTMQAPAAHMMAPQSVAQQQPPPPPPPGAPQQAQIPPYPYHAPQPPPQAGDVQPFWRRGTLPNQQNIPIAQASTDITSISNENSTNITSFDWDESVISEYYRLIHQTFPLLPSSKHRLRATLTDCPSTLREAFLAALDCLMRTFPTTTLPSNAGYPQALKKAAELLARYPFDNPSTHTNATNLVYLQTLLLMALEGDNHGPATIRGQAGPSRAEWLGRAAGVAGQLEINVLHSGAQSQSVMAGDRDSEERLARRVWWVLFILDRWHASSTADLLKLPENSVVLLPEDQMLLGESTYHLARLSFIIGHLAAVLTTTKTPSTDVMAPSNPASSLLGLTLAGEIDRFRESVESVWGSLNLVHLSYHHCHLLIKRLNPNTEPTELVGHAVKVATVLNSRLTPVTPLNHHFGALAAMTLCELCDVAKTRDEALKGLAEMAECLGQGRGLAGKQESEGWDGACRELVLSKRARIESGGGEGGGGLNGLANAAAVGGGGGSVGATTGESGNGVRGGEKFDPTMLTRYGYLTALGQGMFRTR